MSSPIASGILSYGMSGRVFHAPFLSANPTFKLKAVVERHNKKAADRYPDIISYDSIDELINDTEIELVIVNTPNYLHLDHTKQALLAGKHVLLEKPAATTSDEVYEMFDLARKMNKHLMLYQNGRWDSGFLAIKEIIESGRLGDLIEVQFRFDRFKPQPGVKFFKERKDLPASGIVYDLGPHLIDSAIALFGKPSSFDKVTAIHRKGSEVPDHFSYRLTYPGQLNVYLSASLLSIEPLPSFVAIGSSGTFIKGRTDVQEAQLNGGMQPTDPAYGLETEGSEGKLVTANVDGEKTTEWIPSKKGSYEKLFEAVYQTIRHDAPYPITAQQIMWQLALLQDQ